MSKNKTLNLISLGCAKNLVDSEILLGGLNKSGVTLTQNPEEADTIVVNTCGFLDIAREESVETILQAAELKKSGNVKELIVMGCLSERYPDELNKEIPEVDRIFGSNDHKQIVSFLTGKEYSKDDPLFFRSLMTPDHYAYLKIAEGCDNGCSFCSIPLMRGLQKSRAIPAIMDEAEQLVSNGTRELLVIAQDSTSYGWDLDIKAGLHDLFDELDKIEEIEWLRLHYAHPAHLNRKMIERFSTLERLIPYIDMPVQHGSEKMLKDMRRGLGPDGIRRRIDNLRECNSDMAIRTSIIVGFPGETDKEFKELLDFIQDVEFDRLGVFTYSEEEGTHGANVFEDNVPKEVKNERYEQVMMLQQAINFRKNKELIGTTQRVLVDICKSDNLSLGRTYRDSPEIDNYVKINQRIAPGTFCDVKITDAMEYDLVGEVC